MMRVTILILLALLVAGCGTKEAPVKTYPSGVQKIQAPTATLPKPIPSQPKKKIQLKEVQSENYSAAYMYPEDEIKQPTIEPYTPKQEATTAQVTKEECIAMIGQEKFDKYTQMFSDESATIKRCTMMKAMQQ